MTRATAAFIRHLPVAPAMIKSVRRKVDVLERQVDAAFKRGDLDSAEELDVRLAELRDRLTSAAAALLEDEESFDDEAGLEEQLVAACLAHHAMSTGRPCGPFNTPADAIENMRDAILSVGGKPGTAEHVVAAAQDAYEAALQRRRRQTGVRVSLHNR